MSPAIATWITSTFGIAALALRDIGLRDAEDPEIFEALTCGNTSNARLREILSETLPKALDLLRTSEALVEISGD